MAAAAGVVAAGPARAEGGESITTAPLITPGQPEVGEAKLVGVGSCGVAIYQSWWLLPAAVGDRIRVDWEASSAAIGLSLFQPGTTEFNFEGRRVADDTLNSYLKGELTYTATQGGSMPLRFSTTQECSPFPASYNFTVQVTHAPGYGTITGILDIVGVRPQHRVAEAPPVHPVEVSLMQHGRTVGHTHTGRGGRFTLRAVPGSYTVVGMSPDGPHFNCSARVTVKTLKDTRVHLTCQSP